jgi:hypothetical protein
MDKNQIQTIWDTFDFTMDNISILEDKVSFFVSQVDKKAALVEADVITEEKFINFCEESLANHKNLISFYEKQMHTVRDILSIDLKLQPIEREVSTSTLKELLNLTATLKLAIEDSASNLDEMIQDLKSI